MLTMLHTLELCPFFLAGVLLDLSAVEPHLYNIPYIVCFPSVAVCAFKLFMEPQKFQVYFR